MIYNLLISYKHKGEILEFTDLQDVTDMIRGRLSNLNEKEIMTFEVDTFGN